MGRIATSIGLITGTPIQDTVNQLINLSAIPRNRLQSRNELLTKERTAITDVTVLAIGVQLAAKSFGNPNAMRTTSVASADAKVLAATRQGAPEPGSYSVQTLQVAGTQSFRTKSFPTASRPLGTAGTITVRGGGAVDRTVSLDSLNGGRGVSAGAIRITDRAGQVATIDLSRATTVQDVLQAINDAGGIDVSATTEGDAIKIIDRTGKTDSNLIVQEVNGGQTAADLGLRGIDVSSNEATGNDIYQLFDRTRLSTLRDGRGLSFGKGNDVEVNLRDGTKLSIDFSDFSRAEGFASGKTNGVNENASLTLTAKDKGSEADGVRLRFVDDASIAQGDEKATLITGSQGTEIVVSINEGETTAADVVTAIQRNSGIFGDFSITAGGDGTGLVSADDQAVLSGGAKIEASDEPTIEDLLRAFNIADPSKLRAELSPGRDSIQVIDLTSGANQFNVRDLGTSSVANELGLTNAAVDGQIRGSRLQSGLSSVALGALAGGQGIGELGTLDVQLSSGASVAIDLSAAASLQDVINKINDSGIALEATLNAAGTGLQLRDFSGGTTSAFSVSSSDSTAQRLGIRGETTDVVLAGNDLGLQFVSRATRVSDLMQGKGVGDGTFRITDSSGKTAAINLRTGNFKTVGQLIDAINDQAIGVRARINETGDGIRLIDTASGAGKLKVEEVGNGTSARKLGLAGTAVSEVIDGEVVSTIDGRQADVFKIGSQETLAEVATRIKSEGRFATAAVLGNNVQGASLSITSLRGGDAGRITLQSTGLELGAREVTRGRDAVIAIGDSKGGTSTVFRSADGVFTNAISGVSLTAKEVTAGSVQVNVTEDSSGLEGSLKRFVDQYNKLRDKIKELTFYNADTTEVGLLFGKSEVVRIQNSMGRALTGRYQAGNSSMSPAMIGLTLDQEGALSLDSAKMREAISSNREAVEAFLTTKETGFVARVDQAIESIAGANNGLLITRTNTLNNQIDRNTSRIESMNRRLEVERTRLLKQFYGMEEAIAKLQSSQKYVSSIQTISFANS